MLGSLIIFASGVLARSPSSAKASAMRCSSDKKSGKFAKMRPASEISLVSTSIPAFEVNALTIGRKL